MTGETNLLTLLALMNPKLNEGEYVFSSINGKSNIDISKVLCSFREEEGLTVIVDKIYADEKSLTYSFIASWITLTIHSSLVAVGLTAAFSKALADENISCNIIAAFFHDHVFVSVKDAEKAMSILNSFTGNLFPV